MGDGGAGADSSSKRSNAGISFHFVSVRLPPRYASLIFVLPPIGLIYYRAFHDKVALKHLMETVVPVLTALKHVLERAHSPLLRELMFYFGELFRWATKAILPRLFYFSFRVRTTYSTVGCQRNIQQ